MTKPIWVPSWKSEDVEIKEANFVYRGFYQVQQLKLRHRCFSGEWSPWGVREQVHHSDAAAVLLIDMGQQKLVLIEQFRIGLVSIYKNSPWLLEVVAGIVEPGEKPEDTARREAEEEAGCPIHHLIPIMSFFNSPGGFAEKTTLFCGLVNSKGVSGIHAGIEDEDILVHVLDIDEVLQAFNAGTLLTSSSTMIALQWLALQKEKGTLETLAALR